jgi:hypothetical protein
MSDVPGTLAPAAPPLEVDQFAVDSQRSFTPSQYLFAAWAEGTTKKKMKQKKTREIPLGRMGGVTISFYRCSCLIP